MCRRLQSGLQLSPWRESTVAERWVEVTPDPNRSRRGGYLIPWSPARPASCAIMTRCSMSTRLTAGSMVLLSTSSLLPFVSTASSMSHVVKACSVPPMEIACLKSPLFAASSTMVVTKHCPVPPLWARRCRLRPSPPTSRRTRRTAWQPAQWRRHLFEFDDRLLVSLGLALALSPLPLLLFPTLPWALATSALWFSHVCPSPSRAFLLPSGSLWTQHVRTLPADSVSLNVLASMLNLFKQFSKPSLGRCMPLHRLHFCSVAGAPLPPASTLAFSFRPDLGQSLADPARHHVKDRFVRGSSLCACCRNKRGSRRC